MTFHKESQKQSEPALVGIETCINEIFPDPDTRPAKRTFMDWKSKRYFPVIKIGKRVFLNPDQVRKALEKRFTVDAID